jgi:soluble lytic murein transglycosylase-like protein
MKENYETPVIWRSTYEGEKRRWFHRWIATVLMCVLVLCGSFLYFKGQALLIERSGILQQTVTDYKARFEILNLLRTKGISLSQGLDIADMVIIQSRQLGLPLPLILAVMGKESEYLPHAISRKDARGLMQLLPATFELYVRKLNLDVSQSAIFDPIVNIKIGTHYLRDLYDEYRGKVKTDAEAWKLTLSCYNAGPMGGIQKGYVRDVNKLSDQIGGRMEGNRN